jgi:lysophospholipase L1-like esterase
MSVRAKPVQTFARITLRVWLSAIFFLAVGHASGALYVPVEGASDDRWKAFETQLKALQSGRQRNSIRILQLGDSHTAGEFFAGRMRQRFQHLFGDAGVGLMPPGVIKDHPFFQAKILPSAQWVTNRGSKDDGKRGSNLLGLDLRGLGGYAGYGLGAYQSVMYAFPPGTEVSHLYVYFGGSVVLGQGYKLFQNGQELKPDQEEVSPGSIGREVFDVHTPTSRLTLLAQGAGGNTKLLGVTALSSRAGVVYSNIGVNGAPLDILRSWDGEATRSQLHDYAPALIILAFGTNDVINPDFSAEKFSTILRSTNDWIARNVPDAAVLMIMPPHAPGFGARGQQSLDMARQAIRNAAYAYRWRVWDWSELTERNCVSACYAASAVPFFRQDGIHLTKEGYLTTADALFYAIMKSIRIF